MRLHWPWTGKASLGLERQTFRPAPLVALYKATETSLQSLGGAPVCLGMGLPRETGCAVRGTPPQGVLLTGEEKLNCMLLQRFCCFPCFHHFFFSMLLHCLAPPHSSFFCISKRCAFFRKVELLGMHGHHWMPRLASTAPFPRPSHRSA